MPRFGVFLSTEEHGPTAVLEQAKLAEAAGFDTVTVSDHFHPWLDSQGESAFVWSLIGGIGASTNLEVTTAVTCPTMRIHPAILAQATATSSSMLGGRFRFGVGTGERLNEHVLGQHWPPVSIRQDMLREAVELMRDLWTGQMLTRRGEHYTVENARIYTTPDGDIPVIVSAFGPESGALATEIGDGVMTTSPDGDLVEQYRTGGGKGPSIATVKVCWGPDEEEAKKIAHELWKSSGVPGEAAQELSVPRHFEEAAANVTPEQVAEKIPCGPDPDLFAERIKKFVDAGLDEIHLGQIGPHQQGFYEWFRKELIPRL